MGEIFGSIYCWFEEFFGEELANYLWGEASPLQDSNMFIGIGMSMLAISFFVMVAFYYIVNHPRLCNWWGWLIFVCVSAVVNFIVGWQWVLRHLYAGNMVAPDPQTGLDVPLNIDEADCICFGVSNMILSILAVIIFSFIIKWKSTNVSQAPF